ncbi:hypothetical protein IMZ38_01660 [Thermosphaera chiliense]|uniref:Uncharacterized protein n=1 Tax=Thermosphaera chiliense TaxID=3402707 RepID=A0A7M1UQY0_9CREN|nr:hypothetical protein [Thermosphaera aggregans]QOR94668.1 hypothetical protein IMZ38_01660 [Thermosphaera aggregans]
MQPDGTILADDGRCYKRNEVEVHHEGKSFKDILEGFLRQEGLRLEDIKLEDIGEGYRLADRGLAQKWREFHRKHAHLLILPRRLHLEKHGQKQK